MNANQHYRRALGLLSTLNERLMSISDGDSRWSGAMYHLAMGLALDGAERTAEPEPTWPHGDRIFGTPETRPLIRPRFPKPVGRDTVALNCDECGELPPCAHRDQQGRYLDIDLSSEKPT